MVPGDLVDRSGLQEVLGMLRVRGLTGVLRRIKADVTRAAAAEASPQLADQQSS
jgi:cysteine desulfuration protein SufE